MAVLRARLSQNAARILIDDPAARDPARVAILTGEGAITYGALAQRVNRMGNCLAARGCATGDRVLLALPDSIDLAAALLGVIKIGALAVPVAPGMSTDDYAFYIGDTGARWAVADAASSGMMPRGPGVSLDVLCPEAPEPAGSATPLEPLLAAASPVLEPYQASPADSAMLLYTSGTTGRQKAAVHTHAAVAAQIRNVGLETFGIAESDRVLSTARLSFSFGLGFGLSMPLAAGASTILHPTRDLRELAAIIATHRPTIVCGVPSLLDALLRASIAWLNLDLSSVRFIVSAGEPLPPVVYDGYQSRFGVEVLDGIGSTEMLTHFITNRPGRSRRGTCGRPVEGCSVTLVDDQGVPVPDGEAGHLRVKTETAFAGYWRRPQDTARATSSLGVATGDTLYRDASGFYRFCGRSDDMIKVSGLWVSPSDVEAVLREHPSVEQCAVTVKTDEGGRRRLTAWVVPGANVEELDVPQLCRYTSERLPAHMIPAAIVVVPGLPRTSNGKVKRAALR